MAVWLHAKGTRAAISRRLDSGKFLRCRLDASFSGMGDPDLSERWSYIFGAAHAWTEASLGNKKASGGGSPDLHRSRPLLPHPGGLALRGCSCPAAMGQ